jgi:CRISPR-associated protein Cmr2
MQRDHYASMQITLSEKLGELEQAAQRLDHAKQQRDKNARQQAEREIELAANQAVQIEPHLAYLWFAARGSELDNAIRDAWQKKLATSAIPEAFDFLPDDDAIFQMPALSFLLRVPFRLRKPYLSKDDTTFHLLDNPVRKEKIFQAPMVAATGWKGALRAAMVRQLVEWWSSLSDGERQQRAVRKAFVKRRAQLARLFGNEKGVQTDDASVEAFPDTCGGEDQARLYRRVIRRYCSSSGFFAGRLHFFATFFDKIGLEVINPHNRQSGVGERGPILMECVPQGTTGTLLLLYVPFGSVDQQQAAEDLEGVAHGLHAMLTTYGFGAKTSSGFGVVEEQLAGQGRLLIRAAFTTSTSDQSVRLIEPQIPANVQSFRTRYPDEDFRLKPKEWRDKHKATNRDQAAYTEARAAFLDYQTQLSNYQQQVADWEKAVADAPPPRPPVTERTFTTLSGLQEQARQVAAQLLSGGEG